MRNILCLSTSDYYPYPTRKQNVMNRMEDAHIIYVNPPVSLIARFKDPAAKEKAAAYKNAPVEAKKDLWVYAQPPVLPFFNKKRIINVINQRRLAKYLAPIINSHGFGTDFTIWCYSPCSADLIAPLARELGMPAAKLWKHTVYDCVDRHSAYPGLITPEVVDAMEEDLAAGADQVFATAAGLAERLSAFNPKTVLIPNGANYELFSKAVSLEAPEHTGPRLGFVGALQECIDYDILEAVARAFPDGRLVFVGKKLPGVDLSRLEKYRNVEFRGLVPQEELPGHIAGFDVCLNVFADNNLAKDVSPLKFYEYLATGKPVVSTAVPLQVKDFADCIYIAENAEQFVSLCREALSETKDSPKRAGRLAAARECSWEARVAQMRNILGW